jgi:MFS family permease
VLTVLRNRDFGLLWVSGLVSVAGDWILYAALPFYVYERTGSTIATAGMIVAELAPAVLLGSVAGVFVDRWERKRVLVASNLLQAAAVALLLLVPLEGWLWVVYAVAAAQSAVAAFAQPAESALLPTLVPEERLLAANALNALNNRLARLAGLPIGAALLGLLGLRGVVLVDCLSFVLAALLVAPIASRQVARTETGADAVSAWSAFWAEWREGLRLVGSERLVALLFVVFGLMTFGGTMLDPLTVAWVRDVLGEGPEVFAWLLTAHAASGIAATLAVGRLGAGIDPRALIGWSSVAVAAALAVRHNVPSVPLALGLTAVAGVTSVASSVGVETLAQRAVPDEYRGRVFGSLGATLGLLSLLGATAGGTVAEAVGIVPMLNVATALIALSGVVVLCSFPRGG